MKNLGRVIDTSHADGGQRADVFRTAGEDLEVIDRTPLPGRFETRSKSPVCAESKIDVAVGDHQNWSICSGGI